MKIAENWKEIATKHYSTLALYGLLAAMLIPSALFYIIGIDTNPVVWSRWMVGFTVFALIGKYLVQTDEGKWVRRAVIAAALLAAVWASAPAVADAPEPIWEPVTQSDYDADARIIQITAELIAKWEGLENHAYEDIVGVVTVCYGHTERAYMGLWLSDSECWRLLLADIPKYRDGVQSAFTAETIALRLPPKRDAAFTSLTYNIGIRAASRSTAVRRLNRGNVDGACDALTWFNRAGGRVVFGLVRRRTEESVWCLDDAIA